MLILTLLVATLIVVICFICLLYFVANVLDKRCYIIVLINNSYQLIDANTLENYVDNVNNVLDIDERDYLDITLISFSLFIIYLFCTHKDNKNFFDKYFNKHYDTIVY